VQRILDRTFIGSHYSLCVSIFKNKKSLKWNRPNSNFVFKSLDACLNLRSYSNSK